MNSLNIQYLSKIFSTRSPPPALRELLYPLQFLSPEQPLFPDRVNPNGPDTYRVLISRKFPIETAKIADTFAQCLHPSSRGYRYFRRDLALLQAHELPRFWTGDILSQNQVVPTRWIGGYLYLPFESNAVRGDLKLTDITLEFSSPTTFSFSGNDSVGAYIARQGKIHAVDADGRRRVTWMKDYGGHQWLYEGMLEGGGQRIVGVWGTGNPIFDQWMIYGLFMFWAVPDDAIYLHNRV